MLKIYFENKSTTLLMQGGREGGQPTIEKKSHKWFERKLNFGQFFGVR